MVTLWQGEDNEDVELIPCNIFQDLTEWPSITIQSEFCFNIVHLNIRSIYQHWDELITFLQPFLQNIHYLILTEINIKKIALGSYNLNNFEKFYFTREEGRGGGVLIFVQKGTLTDEITRNGLNNTFENVHVRTKLTNNKYLHVVGVYRPPHTNKIQFLEEIERVMENIPRTDLTVLVGDFNIDLNKSDNICNELLNRLSALGLCSAIRGSTREEVRVDKISSTCIDLIFVRGQKTGSDSAIVNCKISDHYLTCCHVISSEVQLANKNEVRKVINEVKMKQLLKQCKWEDILLIDSAEKMYLEICKTFKLIYDECTYDVVERGRKDKPWFLASHRSELKVKNELFKLYKKNPKNKFIERTYKKFRNKLNKKLKTDKNAYYKNCFDKVKYDLTKYWAKIREVVGKKKLSIDETVLRYLGKTNTVENIVCNFGKTFTDEIINVKHNCDIVTYLDESNCSNKSMFLSSCTTSQVIYIIDKLSVKSPGVDGIRAQDVKFIKENIAPVISKLINLTLLQGIPQSLKCAIYRPVYKNDAHSNYQNYRPLAQLSFIHKTMEKFISNKLNKFLVDHSIIHPRQYSYQKGKGTATLLTDFSQLVYKQLNDKKQVLVALVDFSKAFEVLDLQHILRSLREIGVSGKVEDWFKSYLENRSFQVRICDTLSDHFKLSSGVPTGSILGPVLYLIYTNKINCLFDHTDNTDIFSYADDTALVVSHQDLDTAEEIMQRNWDKLMLVAHDLGLIINSKKTKIIHIHSPQFETREIKLKSHSNDCLHNNLSFGLPCDCTTHIENVTQVRYLGLLLDSRFKWNVHTDHLVKRLRSQSYYIFLLRNFLSQSSLRMVYCTLVEGLLRYGLLSYGNTFKVHLNTVTAQQKRILKAMSNKPLTQDDPLKYFKKFNVLPVTSLFKYIIIMKYYNSDEYKNQIIHDYSTRGGAGLTEFRFKNDYGRQLLDHTVPEIFNQLPTELKTITSKRRLKMALRDHFLTLNCAPMP